MRQRPLFTVLCVAGTIASGVFLSGQVGPAPARPSLVTLDKADAAKLAERRPRRGPGRDAGRRRAQAVGARRPDRRSGGARGHARRHRLRRRHAAQQPAARHPRPPGLDDDRAHDEDGGGPAPLLPQGDGAGQQREERLDPRRERRRQQGHPRPRRVQGARLPRPATPTATASPTSRRSSTRASTTTRRGTSIGGVLSRRQGSDRRWCRPASTACATPRATACFNQRTTIAEGINIHPAFGGHGVSGVLIGPGRAPLLGSRRHRPPRRRHSRQDLVRTRTRAR